MEKEKTNFKLKEWVKKIENNGAGEICIVTHQKK